MFGVEAGLRLFLFLGEEKREAGGTGAVQLLFTKTSASMWPISPAPRAGPHTDGKPAVRSTTLATWFGMRSMRPDEA